MEEVLAAGRRLARAGYPIVLYRRPGRPLPRGVEGPWDWPPHRRVARIVPRAGAALTVTPAWGVSAAPTGPSPLGRAGPWADEASDIERAYGPDRTLHVSLEEFARTLSTRQENRERFREGGVRGRDLAARLGRAEGAGEIAAFDGAFRRFRAFDRPNVLHLFATFRRSPAFAREFPSAVQTGPLWPGRYSRAPAREGRRREWVWYASPASAEELIAGVEAGLADAEPPVRLLVRTPRPWRRASPGPRVEVATGPVGPGAWHRRFRRAEVRIVTGSRSLLEALEVGGPFLYFNGVLGSGPARRRHRPEKVAALLALARDAAWPDDVRRDIADFARGRRVTPVVARVASRDGGWAHRWSPLRPRGFRAPFDDAGAVVLAAARSLATGTASAARTVARLRAGSNP
ncbi:MAG: hypothetical protein ACLQC7_01095 [Thermoplasmata archaeon]